MDQETEISVVIPFYNEALNLEAVLQALYDQQTKTESANHHLYEVILVNNNSVDNSVEIINAFAHDHPELKVYVVDEKRAGVAWARKTGMDLAVKRSYERDDQYQINRPFYIFGADADCNLDRSWLIELYNTMQKSKAAIGVCQYYYPKEPFAARPRLWNIVKRILDAREVLFSLMGSFPDGKGFAVLREKYEKIGGIEIFYQLQNGKFVCHLSDDWDFGIRMRAMGEEIVYSQDSKVEINPRRLERALDETIQGFAYGKDGIIVMRDIRPEKKDAISTNDLTEDEANMLYSFAIKDFVPKNIILPLFLTPAFFEKQEVIDFLTPEFAERLAARIDEIKAEMKMTEFSTMHAYKTPCARLYFEFRDELFERMREMISPDIGFAPELPDPLKPIDDKHDMGEFKKFVYFYCEDRESGEMHNYFANGGVF